MIQHTDDPFESEQPTHIGVVATCGTDRWEIPVAVICKGCLRKKWYGRLWAWLRAPWLWHWHAFYWFGMITGLGLGKWVWGG